MQSTDFLRACAAIFSLLATLPANATGAPGLRQPPLVRDTAARAGAASGSRVARARPTTAPPKSAPPLAERPATTQPAISSVLPQWMTLRGIVVRPTGRPCAGASVYTASTPRQLAVTDAQGAFTLPVPTGAAVLLRVEYFGEGSSRVEVRLPTTDVLRITLGQ